MSPRFWKFASALCLAIPVHLYAAGESDRGLSVTVYNNDLALVRDVRSVTVAAGTGDLRFAGVAAQIEPSSVRLSARGGAKLEVLEQNFEYDLAGADRVLSKYLEQPVQVFTKEGRLFDGKLLSVAGDIVLEKKDGSVQTLARADVQNVDFPKPPQGLTSSPTLDWRLRSDKGGDLPLEVSYLTKGMGWSADYAAVLDPDEKKMEISAWATIENRSGATYEDALLKLAAGEPRRVPPPQPLYARKGVAMAMEVSAGAPPMEERPFYEYHLYQLPRPATLRDQETKQLALFAPVMVAVKKSYAYDAAEDPGRVKTGLEFVNAKGEGLGLPLPAGRVRVYKKDGDGSQEFVGEDQIGHTPKDEKVRMNTGSAFDIAAERKQKESRSLGGRARQDTWEIDLRNRKDADVEVTVIEHLWDNWEITRSSVPPKNRDAHTVEFKVQVPKGGEAVLEYTSVTRW